MPTGTVTFLFTDIEGSTKMWERDAATMQAALARHDEILSSAIETNGGYVFKTVGDAFCAAFPAAPDALDAALAAQRALSDEPWDEGSAIKARIALHTGTDEERDGDYFGPTVNRVARLLSIANGGQVLLSTSTHALATMPVAADALREVTGYTMSVGEARMCEPYMSAARSELGETAFLAAWEEGRAMTEEQAIALALENEESDANLEETEPV
jgi:class 3 adenylate cyclase